MCVCDSCGDAFWTTYERRLSVRRYAALGSHNLHHRFCEISLVARRRPSQFTRVCTVSPYFEMYEVLGMGQHVCCSGLSVMIAGSRRLVLSRRSTSRQVPVAVSTLLPHVRTYVRTYARKYVRACVRLCART